MLQGGEATREDLPWEEYRYTLYAREFGWTPAQVDEVPLSVEPWLLPISNMVDEVLAKRAKDAAKAAADAARPGRGS